MQKRLPVLEVIVCSPSESFRWNMHEYPHHLAKWHHHPEYELHLIQHTCGKMMIGDYVGDFSPGSLVMAGPNLPHNWVSDIAEQDCVPERDVLIQFSSEFADAIVEPYAEMSHVRSLLADAAYGVEFSGETALDGAYLLREIGGAQGAKRLLFCFELFDRLSREPAERRVLSHYAPALGVHSTASKKLQRVIEHLHECYTDTVRLESAARLCDMQESNFSRFFKQQTGHTFSRYVNLLRIHRACHLLSETQLPITDICFSSGFNNTANFNRQFASVCRQTPSEYRKSVQRVSGMAALQAAESRLHEGRRNQECLYEA